MYNKENGYGNTEIIKQETASQDKYMSVNNFYLDIILSKYKISSMTEGKKSYFRKH